MIRSRGALLQRQPAGSGNWHEPLTQTAGDRQFGPFAASHAAPSAAAAWHVPPVAFEHFPFDPQIAKDAPLTPHAPPLAATWICAQTLVALQNKP